MLITSRWNGVPIYLAAGVTSVRDVGNEFDFIRTLHDELDAKENRAIGPHLEFAGVIDGVGPITIGVTTADTPEQAVQWVEKYKAAGAKQIKIYSSVKPEVVKAITAAAHARGMSVTGHIPEGMTAIEGVNDGMDQINHISLRIAVFHSHNPGTRRQAGPLESLSVLELHGPRVNDLISTLQSHHTVLDPTGVSVSDISAHYAAGSGGARNRSPAYAVAGGSRQPSCDRRSGGCSRCPMAGDDKQPSRSSTRPEFLSLPVPTRASRAIRCTANLRCTSKLGLRHSRHFRLLRFWPPVPLALRKNRVRWKSESVAMCCCWMLTRLPTFITPVPCGGQSRKELYTILHRCGKAWDSCPKCNL